MHGDGLFARQALESFVEHEEGGELLGANGTAADLVGAAAGEHEFLDEGVRVFAFRVEGSEESHDAAKQIGEGEAFHLV